MFGNLVRCVWEQFQPSVCVSGYLSPLALPEARGVYREKSYGLVLSPYPKNEKDVPQGRELPSVRDTTKVKPSFCQMRLSGRRGRGLAVTSGVSLEAFCLFLGELLSQSIWSLGATGDHRTKFLTTGPARQHAPLDRGHTRLRSDASLSLAPTPDLFPFGAGEKPLAWQLGHFPGPKASLQGWHSLFCPSGVGACRSPSLGQAKRQN